MHVGGSCSPKQACPYSVPEHEHRLELSMDTVTSINPNSQENVFALRLFDMIVCADDDTYAGYLVIFVRTMCSFLCYLPAPRWKILLSVPAPGACIQLHGANCRFPRPVNRLVCIFYLFCSRWSEHLRYNVRLMSENEIRGREISVQFTRGDQSQQHP